MFDDWVGNFVLGIAVIVLIVMIVWLATHTCWTTDWTCQIDKYEQRVEACMDTDRLALQECQWLAAQK